jgi:hypothetical protein
MSAPVQHEPTAPEPAVYQSLEADSTTEPDAGSDTDPQHVMVSHCSAEETVTSIKLTRPQDDGDSGFSDLTG